MRRFLPSILIVAILVSPVALVVGQRFNKTELDFAADQHPGILGYLTLSNRERVRLYQDDVNSLLEIAEALRGTAIIHRQAELSHYSKLRRLHVADPRFAEIVHDPQKIKAFDHIFLNYYNDPPMTQPALLSYLFDPSVSTLIYDHGGWKIFSRSSSDVPTYQSFELSAKSMSAKGEDHFFVSYYHDTPSNTIGSAASGSFPELPPGLYDFIIETEVTADTALPIDTYFLQHDFTGQTIKRRDLSHYVSAGDHRLYTRILTNGRPLRLVLQTDRDGLAVHSIQVRYRQITSALSHDPVLYDEASQQPVGMSSPSTATIDFTKAKQLRFAEPLKAGTRIRADIKGNGTLTLRPLEASAADVQSYAITRQRYSIDYLLTQPGHIQWMLTPPADGTPGTLILSNLRIIK